MSRMDKANDEFRTRVPMGEESFMVLRAHLLMERELLRYVSYRIEDQDFMREIETQRSQVGSGVGLIFLAQALSLKDEYPPVSSSMNPKFWAALKKLNSIRNKLVHILDPDVDYLYKMMREFIQLVDGNSCEIDENINKKFYFCANRIISCLALDRYPIGDKYHREILEEDFNEDDE